MSSEKLSTLQHHGTYSAFKIHKKSNGNRLAVSTSKLNTLCSADKTLPYRSQGSINEEYFMKTFNDTPTEHCFSEETEIVLEEIRSNICMTDNWEKRVDAMKKLRTVVMSFRGKYNSILQRINLLDVPLEVSLKDLKSHVVREACITIAFLSVNLQQKFDHFAEVVFTTLMTLIQSSVKVISSSGATCIRFILKSTHNAHLIPMLVHHMNSKSVSLRCAVCEFIDLILYHWKTKLLERHINLLIDTIRLGISDANSDTRTFSRQAFWHFLHHFPEHRKMFLNSLDPSYRRFIFIGMTRSASSLTGLKSLSVVGENHPLCLKRPPSKSQNCETNKINQGKSNNFDSSELLKKQKYILCSDQNKVQLSLLPESEELGNHAVNLYSGIKNEMFSFNNSNVSTNLKIKKHNTKSGDSVQLKVTTKLYNETFIDSSNKGHQDDCAGDKKSSMSDNVRKIIMNLSSTSLKNKVTGLMDLQIFFHSGNILGIRNLKLVTDMMRGILKEDCTDFFGLFLDTLSELLVYHKNDLNCWLDQLLMDVLKKFNTHMPKQFENLLARVLDVIKVSFPLELQLLSLLRFLKENLQIENINAIAVALNYVYILICSEDLGSNLPTKSLKDGNNIISSVLTKLAAFTVNKTTLTNHREVQEAAKEVLLKLYVIDVPQIKISFSQMPLEYQKVIKNLISGKLNNTVTNGDNSSSLPNLNVKHNAESQFENNSCNNDIGKPEKESQVITTEILDFQYGMCKKEEQNDTTSKFLTNQIISQMKNEHNLKEVHDTSEFGLHNRHSVPHYFKACGGGGHCTSPDSLFSSSIATDQENELAILAVLKSLNIKTEDQRNKCSSPPDKISSLNQLMEISERTSSFIVSKHFKLLLRTLFNYMSEMDTLCSVLALEIGIKLLNRQGLTEKFNNYTELLIFQLLLLCAGKNKQVAEKAVICLNTAAVILDTDTVIRISVPLALTSQFPANVAAINTITMLVKRNGREPIEIYVPELMPILIQSLESVEILLRKAALFCIVSLYLRVGKESIMHFLATLDHSKMKLLMIYVQKAREDQNHLKT